VSFGYSGRQTEEERMYVCDCTLAAIITSHITRRLRVTKMMASRVLKRTTLQRLNQLCRSLHKDGSVDRFAAQAKVYSKARPKYPKPIVDLMVQSVHRHDVAVDVGTGSGQLAVSLSSHFQKVLALDQSPAQLSHAKRKPNITYEQGEATAIPAEHDSVDLVTAAQCYHWFLADDTDTQFLHEAHRVLRPDGRLAVLGYGVCKLNPSPLQTCFEGFYYQALGSHLPPSSPECWWDIDRRLLDKQLEGVVFPGFRQVQRESLVDRRELSLGTFLEYVESFSAYQTLKAQLQDHDVDPLDELQDELGIVGGGSDTVISVDYPFFCITLAPA
jgi:SAM-dependent methyltransferase